MQKILDSRLIYVISITLLSIAIIIGAITRLYTIQNYTQFQFDQARDAFVITKIRSGEFPTLGPGSSIGGYSTPPAYYYLAFLFSFGSADPVSHVISNAFLSFLSIPLLFYFILLLSKGFKSPRAWLVASASTLWWSIFFTDILLSNTEWNPNSIPFFLLSFLIVLHSAWNNTGEKNKLVKASLYWALLGVITGILIGLHSSTLFVIPLVLVIITLVLFWFKRRFAWPVLFSWLAFGFMNILYVYGEVQHNWQNTTSLFNLITKSSDQTHTILERFQRPIFNYLELSHLAYFPYISLLEIATFGIIAVLILAVIQFKGNKLLWLFTWLIWLVYSYSVSNYWGIIFIHYKALIWFAPVIFTAMYFIFLDLKKISQVTFGVFILLFVSISIFSNIVATKRYISSKFGQERLVNTNDLKASFAKLPDQSLICTSEKWFTSYQYIAYTLKEKNLTITQTCPESNFVKLHYKYEQNDDLKLYLNPLPEFRNNEQILFENEALITYRQN